MSGIEGVISLISGIITILDNVNRVSSSMRDGSKLPDIYRDASGRLPLIKDTLRVATECLTHSAADEASCQALSFTLENCMDKVVDLQGIYRKAARPGDSAIDWCQTAALALTNATKVAALMKAILEDIQLVADHSTLRSATEVHVEKLSEAIAELTAVISSAQGKRFEDRAGGYIQQVEFSGTGDQILGFGHARQFIGKTQHFGAMDGL
jgi:hypothetical protein